VVRRALAEVCTVSVLLVLFCGEVSKNGSTNRDAVLVSLDGPSESCIRWGSISPMGRGNFEEGGRLIVKYIQVRSVQKQLNR